MSYPLIILGAGASYDYEASLSSLSRPPLTDDLLKSHILDTSISNKYMEVTNLFSIMRPQVELKKKTFEESLLFINNQSVQYAGMKQQIIALQFYLRDFFEKISVNQYNPINNYRALVDNINRYSQGRACVVNFNYDTLFEKSFDDKKLTSINSYINSDLKLIKLHGSHDWAYIGEADREKIRLLGITKSFEYLKKYPDHIDQLRKNNVQPYHINEIGSDRLFQFPAIAIPLPEKQDYVCPPLHISSLEQALNKIDRILIIGWKAGDQILLDLIKANVNKVLPLTIVSGDSKSTESIREKFGSVGMFKRDQFIGGFTDFISSDAFTEFFN